MRSCEHAAWSWREKEETKMMMGGMMAWMMFWMFFGTLLFIAVIGVVIWLVVRALRPQRQSLTAPLSPQQEPPAYQQGYQPTVTEPETYQEGGQTYPYSEQPSATYPPAPQAQREQQHT
jgi:predicted lipid-binding transport protein (Tim44 family)